MAGFRDEHDAGSRDAEVFIVDADGWPMSAPKSPGSQPGTGRRLSILLGVIALFAFGVVVGRGTLDIRSGSATRADATAVAPTSTSEAPARSSDVTPSPSSQAKPEVESSTSDPTREPGMVPEHFPQAINVCGGQSYVAQVGYVAPLPEPINMTITAGSPPRRYDLNDGTVSPPLVELGDYQFTSALAADDHGTVATIRSRADWFAKIVRVASDGVVTTIKLPTALPPEWGASGTLVDVDGQIWAEVTERGGYGHKLLATDGSGNIEPMPDAPNWVGGDNHALSPDGSRSADVAASDDSPSGYRIEVTDQATGESTVVPGIRLGAAGASLAFSPDSKWLVVVVNTLAGGRILLYSTDSLQGPYAIPGTVGSTPPHSGTAIYVTGE